MYEALIEAQEKLGKPYRDLKYLLECFREVLVEIGENDLAKAIPWINLNEDVLVDHFTNKHVQLYSIAFQLLNMVEENWSVQSRRKQQDERGLASINGLWANNLQMLKDHGVDPAQIAEQLATIRVEPVLTAHPTEAKRQTVLEHHRHLYLLMVKMENQMYSQADLQEIRRQIKLSIETLWRTGEVYAVKPEVRAEFKNVLYYLSNVFPTVLPLLDRRLFQAWREMGWDTDLLDNAPGLPHLSFGNWVGGDRDGHPLVTDEVTDNTLQALRLQSIVVLRRELLKLVDDLSFHLEPEEAPPYLTKRLNEMAQEMGPEVEHLAAQYPAEVFRHYCSLLITKLPVEVKRQHATELLEEANRYRFSWELIEDLLLLKKALVEFGARRVAYTTVKDVIRAAETFGFHLAHLDVRQNSSVHDLALSQLMELSELPGKDFLEWSEEERLAFIEQELHTNRPFTHPNVALPAEAQSVVSCYEVVAKHINRYGISTVGSLIVSMTRSLSDLLTVYVLAREGGMTFTDEDGLVCKLQVVPLLETIEDLKRGPQIIEDFLKHPITQRSLEYQRKEKKHKFLTQQVMVGYSDSNKDGGILASQWHLYRAQSEIARIGQRYGVRIRFFHGKGGSISRGAGPTHWFVKALPHSSIQGNLRLTEQGESIAQKYANLVTATYNLELLVAGTTANTIVQEFTTYQGHPLEDIVEHLANESTRHYRDLVTHKDFLPFFSQATPIDAIEQSRIGSRPARRTGKRTLRDLRAIPWVFSWSQARFNMTSWYGLGITLMEFMNEQPEKFQVFKKAVEKDPFLRYILTNVDTSLAATDEDIMQEYANLVDDTKVRDTMMGLFTEELQRTRQMLDLVLEKPFSERRKNHFYSSKLRATAMIPLHRHQIHLLKTWREMEKDAKSNEVLDDILLTVNAIASARRNTG